MNDYLQSNRKIKYIEMFLTFYIYKVLSNSLSSIDFSWFFCILLASECEESVNDISEEEVKYRKNWLYVHNR
jgi:hypothetical protein